MQEKTASVRPAASLLPRSGRMPNTAAMPADRRHTVEALRIMQVAKLTTWNKRNRNPQNVTDNGSGQNDHNPNSSGTVVTVTASGHFAHLR